MLARVLTADGKSRPAARDVRLLKAFLSGG
jgi:hypothetical protein